MGISKIATVHLENVEAKFTVKDPYDCIQSVYLQGRFYEEEDLLSMVEYMDENTRYIDIGANIGNHIIYFAKRLGLKSIVAIEPNKEAITILTENIALNDLGHQIDLSYLGCGLSNNNTRTSMITKEHNLGAAYCRVDKKGDIKLVKGDSLLASKHFDFMKIDIEGMEIKCLIGLKKLIARCRPVIFVEVDNLNLNSFRVWLSKASYNVKVGIKRYDQNQNYLLIPKEKDRNTKTRIVDMR